MGVWGSVSCWSESMSVWGSVSLNTNQQSPILKISVCISGYLGVFASTCNSIAKNSKQMRQWHGMLGKVAKFINFVLYIKRKIIIDAKNRWGNCCVCLYDSNTTELISIWSLAVQISGCISACWWTPAEHHFKLRVLFQFWSLEYAKGWVSWQLGTESLNITQQSYE